MTTTSTTHLLPFTPPEDGPFPGAGWTKWIDYDLSDWWIPDIPVETVTIPVAEEVTLEAWWIKGGYPMTNETVIVTHGYGSSRRDYNALLPSAMLAKAGFNVLLVDQRDTGNSTCVDGRHSAGQDESDDFAAVAAWLTAEKGLDPSEIGMFGVSGGAIATAILPAKTQDVSAFAMEAPIFDFAETARKEVEFQGFPQAYGRWLILPPKSVGLISTKRRFPRESTQRVRGHSCCCMEPSTSASLMKAP